MATTKKVSRLAQILFAGGSSSSAKSYPPVVIAPMVNQSELAYRLLVRKVSGNRVCFTPMMHSRLFATSPKYRKEIFATVPEDRPLIAQFCGNDPETLVAAGKLVQDRVDGIDLNFGCPQKIARRGMYGAFLLEQPDLLESIVRRMASELDVPISCKIRLVPDGVDATVALCQRLERAGCEMITVHGRYREQNKVLRGDSDWDAIAKVKRAVSIPVLANGSISSLADVKRCLRATGVDGVMSCEAVLENPGIFKRDVEYLNVAGEQKETDDVGNATMEVLDGFEMMLKYLELAAVHRSENQPKPAKAHLFKTLFGTLKQHQNFYSRIGSARSIEELQQIVRDLRALHLERGGEEETSERCRDARCGEIASQPWYNRHLRGGESGRDEDDDRDPEEEEEEEKGETQTTKRPRTEAEKKGGRRDDDVL